MDQQIKEQWVTALRSGEYVQGNNVLHRIQGGQATFCCLGVLCDLAVKAGVELTVRHNEHCPCARCTQDRIVFYDGSDDFPPDKVKEWARLPSPNPATSLEVESGLKATLSWMNDNGRTFAEIADIIEEEL